MLSCVLEIENDAISMSRNGTGLWLPFKDPLFNEPAGSALH